MPNCEACKGCALTSGAAANKEPSNFLLATLAVLAPFPFYCHDAFDWRNPDLKLQTLAQLRETGQATALCAGWKREVAALASTGFYKEHPEATRLFAQAAREQLNLYLELCAGARDGDFAEEDLPGEKARALESMQQIMRRLIEKRRKFQPQTESEETWRT